MNTQTIIARDTAARLRHYLLQGPAQQGRGLAHEGAVAGTISTDGTGHYVYGEITGYYLHWLASLNKRDAAATAHALAGIRWLENYLRQDSMPATRIWLDAGNVDWRNQALFAFDLAMIAGGVARATSHQLITLPETLVRNLLAWLQRFVDGTGLKACITKDPDTILPIRWSTTGGSFTAKTASRILLLADQTPVDPALLKACNATLASCALAAERNGLDMLHPTLYALEGCLLSTDADPRRLAAWFDQVVALQSSDGTLPESLQTPAIRRSDIVAQALRVAIFLQRRLDEPFLYREACEGFASALCARVKADGTLSFRPEASESNIWCAMFAEQALRLHAAVLEDQPLPFGAEDLV